MRRTLVGGGIVVVLIVAGVAIALALSDRDGPQACDGIAAEMGGCEEDLPTFAETTCDGIAREFSATYQARATDIFDGPPTVGDSSRSVRLIQLTNLMTQLANRHVRSVGPDNTCDADAFFRAVEADVTAEFKGRVGRYLYEDGTGTYEAWAAEVRTFLAILEDPIGPSSSAVRRSRPVSWTNSRKPMSPGDCLARVSSTAASLNCCSPCAYRCMT